MRIKISTTFDLNDYQVQVLKREHKSWLENNSPLTLTFQSFIEANYTAAAEIALPEFIVSQDKKHKADEACFVEQDIQYSHGFEEI